MGKPSRFWDRHAKGYAKSKVADEESYQKKLKHTQEYLKPDMDVLELGCGTGTTALIHAPFVKHIHGVDISEKMLEIAKSKAQKQAADNVSFEQSAIADFCTEPRQYDLIMTHSILHLLADRDEAIRHVFDMLKPGGIFVSSTVCLSGRMTLMRPVLWLGNLFGLLPMVKFFTMPDLEKSIQDAGFAIEIGWKPEKGASAFFIAKKA